MRKHFLLLMLSISMGASLILTPVTAAAAEEAATADQQAEGSETAEETVDKSPAEELPAETAADKDTSDGTLPAEEKQPMEEELETAPSEKSTAGSEEGSSSVPTGQSEDQAPAAATEPQIESTEVNTAPAAAEEEIKETSVKALQKSWTGPGFYDIFDKKGVFQGCRYMPTKSTWHKGFKTIDGKPYYFDKDTGYLKLGWFTLNGYKYYGNKAVTSYANGRGVLYTGLKTIDGHHYYFFASTKDGHYGKTMAKNTWVTTGGQKFYAGKDGKLVCGFKTIGGKGYYFYPSGNSSRKYGQMAKGWFTYNGFRYYADPSTGVLITGFKTIDGEHYYFYPKTEGNHYAKTMAKGWFTVNGFKYYADSSGALATGWKIINEKDYYFWPKTADGHYSRTMAKSGTFTIDGKKYTFDKNGITNDYSIEISPYLEKADPAGLAKAAGLPYDPESSMVTDTDFKFYRDDVNHTLEIVNRNPKYTIYGIRIGDGDTTIDKKLAGKAWLLDAFDCNRLYIFNNKYHNGYYISRIYFTLITGGGYRAGWSISYIINDY